jgi:hypothetical protein
MKATLGKLPAIGVFGDDYPTPDGTCIRDYIHVDDLADAHLKALDYLAAGGATTALNVGTGVGSSVLEVIAATERHQRREGAGEPGLPRRAGDPVSTFANASKAREVLGWEATRGLDEIIASAWQWHSRTPTGTPPAPEQPAGPAGLRSVGVEPLAVEPAEQHGHCPRVVAQPVAGTVDQPQLGRPVRLGQLAGVGGGHALVVVAVHHQQRARGEPARRVDRAEPAQLTTPTRRSCAGSRACGWHRSRERVPGTGGAAPPSRRSPRGG